MVRWIKIMPLFWHLDNRMAKWLIRRLKITFYYYIIIINNIIIYIYYLYIIIRFKKGHFLGIKAKERDIFKMKLKTLKKKILKKFRIYIFHIYKVQNTNLKKISLSLYP